VAAQRRKLVAVAQRSARKMNTTRRTKINDIVKERDEEAQKIKLDG
jgi:hypothetical protein